MTQALTLLEAFSLEADLLPGRSSWPTKPSKLDGGRGAEEEGLEGVLLLNEALFFLSSGCVGVFFVLVWVLWPIIYFYTKHYNLC